MSVTSMVSPSTEAYLCESIAVCGWLPDEILLVSAFDVLLRPT